jgi:hypothetical protein
MVSSYLEWGGRRWRSMILRSVYARGRSPEAPSRSGIWWRLLTPKFGKESDLWVRLDEESVWCKEGSFQRYSAKRSAVGYLLQFGKGTVELILRDWTVTWLNQEERMDG